MWSHWEILLWPRSWHRSPQLLWRTLPRSCSLYGPGRSLWGKASPSQHHSCQEYILVFWTPVSGAPAVTSAVAAGAAPVAPVSVPGARARLPPFPGSWSGASPPPLPWPWSGGNTHSLSASDLHPWDTSQTLLSNKYPEHQHSPAPTTLRADHPHRGQLLPPGLCATTKMPVGYSVCWKASRKSSHHYSKHVARARAELTTLRHSQVRPL